MPDPSPRSAPSRQRRRPALAALLLAISTAISCDVADDPSQEPVGRHHHRSEEPESTPPAATDDRAKEHRHAKEHGKRSDGNDGEAPSTDIDPAAADSKPSGSASTLATDRDAKPGPGVAWYVTLHDQGARDAVTGQESVLGFGASGRAAGGVLSKVPDDDGALQDLRGMLVLADRSLLVISAWKHNTQILRFGPPADDARRPFLEVFTRSGDDNPLLVHPYAMAVAPDGSILVSNQDSNTVTRHGAPGSANSGKPLGLDGSPALSSNDAGLVVPSHEMTKDGVKEVRGIAVLPDGTLLVADRGKGEVSRWSLATGERLGTIASKEDGIETPIQLLVAPDGRTLYISDNKRNEVFTLALPDGKPAVFIGGDAQIDATSSLAIHDEYLYVGSRKAREILRFRLSDAAPDEKPFIADLPDNPEFLILNPTETAP